MSKVERVAATRTLPHSLEAERGVLGAMLLSSKAQNEAMEVLSKTDFYRPSHQSIFEAMTGLLMTGQNVDTISLTDKLTSDGLLEKSGGASYLADLTLATPTAQHSSSYMKIVKKLSVFRDIVHAGSHIAAVGYGAGSEVDEALSKVMSEVMSLADGKISTSLSIDDVVEDLDQYLESGKKEWIKHPYMPNVRLGGGDLVVIAGGTSSGKTAFSMKLAYDWAKVMPVTYFEYEMDERELASRLLSHVSLVPLPKIQDVEFSDIERTCIKDAMQIIRKTDLRIENVWCGIGQLMAKIRQEAMLGRKVFFIDHIGLVPFDRVGQMSEAKAIGVQLTNPLKRLASELDITIVILVQLNRAGQIGNFPRLLNLRDSGEIEQDASVVAMLWSDKQIPEEETAKRVQLRQDSQLYTPQEAVDCTHTNLIRVGVEKNRNGELGSDFLKFHGSIFTYEQNGDFMELFAEGGDNEDKVPRQDSLC